MVRGKSTEGTEKRERRVLRSIFQLGDPALREVAARVADPASPEIRSLVADLADTLAHWRASTGYGRGIAAPQIGAARRVIFLQLPSAEPWPLVNPEITWRSEEKIVVWDACLSFLSIFMQMERHREIVGRYQNSIQVIDLVLRQFREIPCFARQHFLPLATQVLR